MAQPPSSATTMPSNSTTVEPECLEETAAAASIPLPGLVRHAPSIHDSSTPTAGPSSVYTPDFGSQLWNNRVMQSRYWGNHGILMLQSVVNTLRVDTVHLQASGRNPDSQRLPPSPPCYDPSLEFGPPIYPTPSQPTSNFVMQPEIRGFHDGIFEWPSTGGMPLGDMELSPHYPVASIQTYGTDYSLPNVEGFSSVDNPSPYSIFTPPNADPSFLSPTISSTLREPAYPSSLNSVSTPVEASWVAPNINPFSFGCHNAYSPTYNFFLLTSPCVCGAATLATLPFLPKTPVESFTSMTQSPPHESSGFHLSSNSPISTIYRPNTSIQQQQTRPDRQQPMVHRSKHRGNTQGAQRSRVTKARSERQNGNASLIPKQSLGNSSCVQCSVSHKRCIPIENNNKCLRCHTRKYSMSRLPCAFFLQIPDITLFRKRTAKIANKPYDVLSINSHVEGFSAMFSIPEAYTSEPLSFCIAQNSNAILQLAATRFDVTRMAEVAGNLMNGLDSHPFRLLSLEGARICIKAFIANSVESYIKHHVNRQDTLSWSIFDTVHKRVQAKLDHHEFLSKVLQLWVAARTIEGGWKFEGFQFLELIPDDSGTVRLTNAPFIDYQFSAIMVQDVLDPLRRDVLKQLKTLTYANNPANWLTLFLANFILLHSYGLLMKQQRAFARRKQAPWRYSMMDLIIEIHEGAKTLLSYFHHVCKGQHPLEIDWDRKCRSKPAQRMAELSDQEIQFVKALSSVARTKASHFSDLMETDEYETDHWFTGQLFVTNWKPPKTIGVSPPA